ncbi:MAG TPA: prealbumin-like fold domain-containing protein, partial [Gemmataceae bacterium]|nr:prealbumin-like fold domain-containing protein [Gemmataceae bacterium]
MDATIALYASNGTTLMATAITDSAGYYRFDDINVPGGLTPGAYFLVETTAPVGYVAGGTHIFSQLDPSASEVTLAGRNAIQTTIVDPAQLQTTLDGSGYIAQDTPIFYGNPAPGLTGQLIIHLSGGGYRSTAADSFISYCVDLTQEVNVGDTFPVLPTPALLGLANGPEIAYLYNEYGTTGALNDSAHLASNIPFGSPMDNDQGEALQETIWKLEYGANFTPDFHGSLEVEEAYNFYLADASGRNEAAVLLDATAGGFRGQSELASESLNFNNIPVNSNTAAGPAITTTALPTAEAVGGAALQDSAHLSGGFHPTGTITFTLTGPANTVVDTETVPANGNGDYTTPVGFVPVLAGTYFWVASYGGDVNNLAVTSGVHDEPVV